MAIFISYSQKDRKFADNLAANLVRARHSVWMDRWELNVGDSLIEKIQSALTNSSGVLVLLSKNSVESSWCKKELNSTLIRELEERKTLLMPCIIDDCEVPLFLRDKLYADFRTKPDEAFDLVNRSLLRISNSQQGRVEAPKFHTDWSVDWRSFQGVQVFKWVFVDHGHDLPYVVLSVCTIRCNDQASQAFRDAKARDQHMNYLAGVLTLMLEDIGSDGLTVVIEDVFEKAVSREFSRNEERFSAIFSYRRLGIDTGLDTVFHLDINLKHALNHIRDTTFSPPTGG
jgi:hypothetical protein